MLTKKNDMTRKICYGINEIAMNSQTQLIKQKQSEQAYKRLITNKAMQNIINKNGLILMSSLPVKTVANATDSQNVKRMNEIAMNSQTQLIKQKQSEQAYKRLMTSMGLVQFFSSIC